MIRIDDDDYDYCNVPICSSLIKCTSKILYNLYTTPLAPNGPFLGSRLVKNEFKTRIFQETTMRIRNARYYGALIYRNYLDTSSNVNVGWYFFIVVIFILSLIDVTCNLCYQTVPICSSLIKCTSKILYNLYTTPLAPNGPFLGSRLVKNEFKTRIFQETTMRIRNARYYGALIYRNYLDTDDVIG